MSHPILHKSHCACVHLLLLGAGLVLQTSQVVAHDNSVDDAGSISTIPATVVLEDHPRNARMDNGDAGLVRHLLVWINAHTLFTFNTNEVPAVKYLSAGQMEDSAFRKNYSKIRAHKTYKILGLYNFEEGVIYLLDNIDLRSETGKGVLLHELVHFLQYKYGHDEQVSCPNELEGLAYLLELQYLRDNDQTLPLLHTNPWQQSGCASS